MSICKDEKKCPDKFRLDPKTGKCVPIIETPSCPDGYIRNSKTGKCDKVETRKIEGEAISKNRLYVDRELVSGSNFIGYNVLDPVRDLTKHIWLAQDPDIKTGRDLLKYYGPIVQKQLNTIKQALPDQAAQWWMEFTGPEASKVRDYRVTPFKLHLQQPGPFTKEQFKKVKDVQDFLSDQFTTKKTAGPFYDHPFELEVPYDREDIKKFTILDSDLSMVRSNFEYNFQSLNYENLLSGSKERIKENILPNLYVIYSEYTNRSKEKSLRANVTKRFEDLINVAGSLNIMAKGNNPGEPYTVLSNKRVGAYLDRWAHLYPIDPPNDPAKQTTYGKAVKELVKNYSNTGYLSKEAAKIENYKKYVELFPMFTQIKFPTDPGDEITPGKTGKKPANSKNGAFTLPFTDALRTGSLDVPLTGHIIKTISEETFPAHRNWTNLFLKLRAGSKFETVQAIRADKGCPEGYLKNPKTGKCQERMPSWCSEEEHNKGQCSNEAGDNAPGPAYRAWAKKKWPGWKWKGAPDSSAEMVGVPETCHKYFVEKESLKYKVSKERRKLDDISFLDARVWNVTKWWNEFNKIELTGEQILEKGEDSIEVYDGKDIDIATFLGSYSLDRNQRQRNAKYYDALKKTWLLMFAGKAKKIIDEHYRSYRDIYEKGKLAKAETVMYKVSKYDAEDIRKKGNVIFANPIQNFYIPNRSGDAVQEWVDTQVKYDKKYFYQIYAYVMVVGTEYTYEFDGDDKGTVKVTKTGWKPDGHSSVDTIYKYAASGHVLFRPSLILAEIPYASLEGVIVDSPPVAPQVQFFPEVDVNDKVLITLQSGVGDYYKVPIIVDAKDADLYEKLPKKEENVVSPSGELIIIEKIRFKNDDPINKYVCYRVEQKPTSYIDFAGEGEIVDPPYYTTSATKLDKIVPNKKYYYMFRSIDVHGNRSYPSPVYEIEMEDEGGAYFLSIKIVEFSEGYMNSPVRGMKRYIHIKPSTIQRTIDERENNFEKYKSAFDVPNLVLGTADKKVFGSEKVPKRFKIRITSKDTGKKIDLNLKFIHKHINNRSEK